MTIREAFNPSRKFKPQVLAALREYRTSKPWAGEVLERIAKLAVLHEKLCGIYGKQIILNTQRISDGVPQLLICEEEGNAVDDCGGTVAIVMAGRISVQRYLCTFHQAVFGDESDALSWGVSLFVRVFPSSAAKLYADGSLLLTANTAADGNHPNAVPMSAIIAEARAADSEPHGTVTVVEPMPDDAPPSATNPENN